MGHLTPLLLGFLLDQLLGDPPGWPHPVRWLGRLVALLEPPLRRLLPERLGGVVLVLLVAGTAGGVAWKALALAGAVHPMARLLLASVLVYLGLAARSLARETAAVLVPCEKDDWPEARRRLARIVGRDTHDLPPVELYRACVETVAENTVDGVVAPLFFAALLGPVGLWVFKAVSTLDSMVGYRTERYRDFGWASARADDLANLLPARLTYLLLALAALLTGRRAWAALGLGLRDGRKHPSPNAGWPEAAMAGALGVQLGGPATYQGVPSEKPRLGEPDQPLTLDTVRQAIQLMLVTAWLALVVLGIPWLALWAYVVPSLARGAGGPRWLPERRAQPQVLLRVERLGAECPLDAQLGQLAIDLVLGHPAARRAGQGAAKVLAAMDVQVAQEAAEAVDVADVGSLGRVGPDADDGRRHLRPWPEHGRRQLTDQLHVGETLHQHRQRPVLLGTRPSQQPLGDLPLQRHHQALRRPVEQEVRDHRHGHRIRQVGDQFEARAAGAHLQLVQRLQDLRPQLVLVAEDVAVDQDDLVAERGDGLVRHGVEGVVELDAEDGTGLLGEADGEAPGAAADLEGQVGRRQLGGAQEQLEQVQVDEEVLAELVLRLDAALLEEIAEV
jgi:adenosylcobinamide-phosphate synthase